MNGKVYVDFYYLGERVRENSGLAWNEQNAKSVREQLDRIAGAIKGGSFRFAEVFPDNGKRDFFTAKEREAFGFNKTTEDVRFGEYVWQWFDLKSKNGTASGRTLRDYKSYITLYLEPFFGERGFGYINASTIEKFIVWARDLKVKKKPIRYESIKKYIVVLKMVCSDAAIEFQWRDFNPFFGFRGFRNRNAESVQSPVSSRERSIDDFADDEIIPFSISEVRSLRSALPDHWKPYFDFAVSSGLRPGEQTALKPHDINWEKGTVRIRNAMTLNIDGKPVEGPTKNKYSRREIRLTRAMLNALKAQEKIHKKFGCKYFFCSPTGGKVDLSNFRNYTWKGTLKKAKVRYRSIRQTRHTFATLAISRGEDLSWIARVMGHANTQMLHRHYARFIEDANGTVNGSKFDALFEESAGKDE